MFSDDLAGSPAASEVVSPATVEFADGLVGLPDLVAFDLRAVPETAFFELVARDEPSFGVVVARADDVRAGMRAALAGRGLVEESDAVLVMLAVHGDPPSVTANLAGPLVVSEEGRGRQLVLEDTEFPLREPLAVG